jgi:amino acid adenylation domain-containing protein/thioester reductase-like protein
LVTIVDQPGQSRDDFVVVRNNLGQHSVWPAALRLPPGWQRRSQAMPLGECVAAVEGSWPRITPDSVPGAGEPPAPAGPGGVRLVHELFADQAARRPDATAIVAGRARLTYRELDESANRLAHYLAEAGTGPETVTGVHLDRSIAQIQAVLAIMKAGGAYLPLDPALPPERLARICDRLHPVAVITAGTDAFSGCATRLLPQGELDGELAGRPPTAPAARPHPDNLCYTIYTSGSTGDPKAVGVSFASLAGVIGEIAGEYALGQHDRVAQVAAMAFDTSLEQVFTALTSGATLIMPPPGTLAPSELLREVERKRITVLDLTPAYWHQLLALTGEADQRLRSVRLMITGGELADLADCRALLRAAPWARLLNAYGLTETTITSALCDVGAWLPAAGEEAVVPVGRPVGRARLAVLDENLEPLPAGAEGEVYIGGPGVARGYLGRPGLTAQRFLPDPGGAPGSRMYRTGDLGRWLPDGSLEIAGRIDRQLKVNGFRVEPGEIESVLAGHPDIDQVSVTATPRRWGDTRLVAYYTPREGAEGGARHPSAASLRHYLADRLPGYMIPSAFTARHRLPDEAASGQPQAASALAATPAPLALPVQETRSSRAHGEAGLHTPAQAALSALWARLLGRDHVALEDDFFALGGNSLLAAEMLAHTRSLLGIPADSVQPLTRRLLRDPTLRGFAAAADEASAGRLRPDGDQAEIDFAAESRLGVTVRRAAPPEPEPHWQAPGEVLLTGATGFLGAHLLSELTAATGARVHCLVRAPDAAAALGRIEQAAARYELPAPPAGRVVPLAGDLTAPRLGLSDAAFRDLARTVDIVYHVGARVNFIYPYQGLRAANVEGTREVIRLAGLDRGIPVHFVSTTAVLAGLGMAGTRTVTEQTPLAHPELLRMGYVETKYVAEELLRAAGAAGLPVAVYRPLDIVGSQRTGAWSTSTEMCALIRFIADTGLAPDIDLPLDFVAADTCAAAIRHISVTEGAPGRTYHLASPASAPLSDLVGKLRERGYRIEAIGFGDWVRELARQSARDPSHPMAAFLPLFVNRGAGGLTVAEMYLRRVFPAYSRDNTERALRGSGITFTPVSGGLMDSNIDRLMRIGYLPSPDGAPLPAHVA